jgi:hypothetical protein
MGRLVKHLHDAQELVEINPPVLRIIVGTVGQATLAIGASWPITIFARWIASIAACIVDLTRPHKLMEGYPPIRNSVRVVIAAMWWAILALALALALAL